jgi:hypothetical protein
VEINPFAICDLRFVIADVLVWKAMRDPKSQINRKSQITNPKSQIPK